MKADVRGADADDRDAISLAQLHIAQRPGAKRLLHLELGQRKAVVELDVVEHGAGDQVRHSFAHVGLGVHDMVCADPLEDAAVVARDGLGPDLIDPEVDQKTGGQGTRLDVGADGNDRLLEVRGADLAHGLFVSRIDLDRMRESLGQMLDALGGRVDPEYLSATFDHGERD